MNRLQKLLYNDIIFIIDDFIIKIDENNNCRCYNYRWLITLYYCGSGDLMAFLYNKFFKSIKLNNSNNLS